MSYRDRSPERRVNRSAPYRPAAGVNMYTKYGTAEDFLNRPGEREKADKWRQWMSERTGQNMYCKNDDDSLCRRCKKEVKETWEVETKRTFEMQKPKCSVCGVAVVVEEHMHNKNDLVCNRCSSCDGYGKYDGVVSGRWGQRGYGTRSNRSRSTSPYRM